MAGEAGVPFFSAAGTEFDQVYVGIGAKKVRDVFRQARDAAPCILFIDEFDGIGKQRTASTSDGEPAKHQICPSLQPQSSLFLPLTSSTLSFL